ncbi:MAG: ComEC/Rec2 family competence protein [Clostridia bacterium]|nr:ComEC/Rec2 family competence protein [Clostridia bacterium]
MKRLINARVPVLLALVAAAGVLVGCLLFFYNLKLYYVTAAIILAAVIFIILAVCLKSVKPLVITVLVLLFFLLGAVNCYIRLSAYDKHELSGGEVYSVTATVCEKGQSQSGEYVILKNIKADGKSVSGKARVYLPEVYGDYVEKGYKVSFTAEAKSYDAFPYGKLNYNAEKNIKYNLSLRGTITAKRGFSLFGSIQSRVRGVLFDNLDYSTASVAYAMLTGNTQEIDEGTLEGFRYGGIAHVFAVSGLHIGIVFMVLSFIMKKLNANKFASAAVIVLCLFLYSGVCGFTLSSLRAAIMCTVSLVAKLAHKKYDGLNSLALSAVIILFITPLNLFSVGFQLSICAVAGICLLSGQIKKPLKKLPKWVSSSVGTSFGAQAATMPVMLANFGYLSGAGLLLNVIIVPVLSLIFGILFLTVLLCAVIVPAAPFVIPYAALPLEAVTSFLLNAGFEKALISGFGAGAFVPLYFLCILLLSDKLNLKRLARCIAFGCAFAAAVIYPVFMSAAPSSGYTIIASANFVGGQVLIKSKSGNVLIVTENLNASRLNSLLSENYAHSLDAVIILGGEDCVTAYGNFGLNCDTVYIYDKYINIQPYENVSVNYEREFSEIGAEFEFYDGYSVSIDIEGVSVAVCGGSYVPFEWCNILIADTDEFDCECDAAVCFNSRGFLYNVYDHGDVTFKVENGKAWRIGDMPSRATYCLKYKF